MVSSAPRPRRKSRFAPELVVITCAPFQMRQLNREYAHATRSAVDQDLLAALQPACVNSACQAVRPDSVTAAL